MEDPYAHQWDPRERWEAQDYGWIGEDKDGVWISRHPKAVLSERPELWLPVIEFESGLSEITERDVDEKSNYHLECKMVMVAACARDEISRAKQSAPK